MAKGEKPSLKGEDGERHAQVTEKRVIEGLMDVTLLPKKPRHLNEEVAILVLDDGEEEGSVNVTYPSRVVNVVNSFIEGASIDCRNCREQASRALRIGEVVSILA